MCRTLRAAAMMSTTTEPGFVRAACPSCGNTDVWLSCNSCNERSRFTLGPEQVTCSCAATYDHAVCTCGETVGHSHLVSVAFEDGPVTLSELEVDWPRVAGIVATVVGLISVSWWLLG